MYNFNSGPAALPQPVLHEAAEALINYDHTGLSILEIPHRGRLFLQILEEARYLVGRLLGLDDRYEVLWVQGGGRLQFAMIPMNFLDSNETAGYIESGHWAAEAAGYASHYGQTIVTASSRSTDFQSLPDISKPYQSDLAYLHLTSNNTIYGTQFSNFPDSAVPLIADMSSDLFSRRLDFEKFSLIYAVAQKNIGPAGVTLVIAQKSFLAKQKRPLPDILSYQAIAQKNSMVNTPPVFAIYCSLLNLRWLAKKGIDRQEKENTEKAAALYAAIDRSSVFYGTCTKADRSPMNVCFRLHDASKESDFLKFAESRKIQGIKGHRSVGGFRAALYNAITLDEVQHLIKAMHDFEHLA